MPRYECRISHTLCHIVYGMILLPLNWFSYSSLSSCDVFTILFVFCSVSFRFFETLYTFCCHSPFLPLANLSFLCFSVSVLAHDSQLCLFRHVCLCRFCVTAFRLIVEQWNKPKVGNVTYGFRNVFARCTKIRAHSTAQHTCVNMSSSTRFPVGADSYCHASTEMAIISTVSSEIGASKKEKNRPSEWGLALCQRLEVKRNTMYTNPTFQRTHAHNLSLS